ncbi:MAG: hypothetical protein AAF550_08360 [Myxococcota bacterium]
MNLFKTPALATALAASLLSSVGASAFSVIDFEGLENGTIVDDEFTDQGVTISGVNLNRDFDFAVAFDTSLSGTEDPDLEAPFFDFIESDFASSTAADRRSFSGDVRDGVNGLINPGNILILQENNIGCGDGVCDVPDDEVNRPNGWFEISFDNPVFLSSIDFFDVETEEDESPDAQITVTTEAGSEIFFTPNTGGDFTYSSGLRSASGEAFYSEFASSASSDLVQSWDRLFFDVAGVTMIRINMGGSGGIDNIRFAPRVPAPATVALLLMGLIALRRRA